MLQGVGNLIKYLIDIQNPIYLSVIVVVCIFIFILLLLKYSINPTLDKFKKEKERIELESAKLMALFAELDPDPVIRMDLNGKILVSNKAASKLFSEFNFIGKNINEFLPQLNLQAKDNFKTTKTFTEKIGKKYYLILFRSDAQMNLAQLYFRNITEQKENEQKLANYQKQLKTFSEKLQEAIEKERDHIAKSLHDGIGQSLSLMRINLNKSIEQTNDNFQANYYKKLMENLEDIINELKSISYTLKPRNLEAMGLRIAVTTLVEKICSETGIRGEFNMTDEEARFDDKIEINIYRIIQEALNNTIKYSLATNFSIQLISSNKFIRLIISDNGIGFQHDEIMNQSGFDGGMGLINIKERVESFGGVLKIDSNQKSGTLIVAEIPLKRKEYELV